MKKTLLHLGLAALAMSQASAVEIIAHRGFSEIAPENTVAAFKLGWEKADACELDLYLTGDNQIVAIHDADTKRTTGVASKVKEATLEALQKLDAGSWKSAAYKGERIPTLAESLASLPKGKQRFFLEIKDSARIVPELAKQLGTWKSIANQLCIIAFDRKVCQECKKAMPWIPVYRLSSEQTKDKKPIDLTQLIADTKADGLDGLDLGLKFNWTPAMVEQIRAAGLKIYVWTVNKPADIKRLAALKIDGITTDDPVMVRETLK
ncbi:glycerophosphodiester phosphodiesterase [Brevifollis gellanilyticus]|uniref:Glycerophosphoryl diester phosphodiesterase n=1 Tax=Brevifollis gellanilyticus TaxID=748831 RepID=A0A512MCN8_9BACT|nr:glycerophosphodiester phosphodiesterase family protein [Brevifollis gellanilyticus]GEP44121.1 glycerophosphoryl diester phosphodiesterase [Brevifollis gellanilyticus]